MSLEELTAATKKADGDLDLPAYHDVCPENCCPVCGESCHKCGKDEKSEEAAGSQSGSDNPGLSSSNSSDGSLPPRPQLKPTQSSASGTSKNPFNFFRRIRERSSSNTTSSNRKITLQPTDGNLAPFTINIAPVKNFPLPGETVSTRTRCEWQAVVPATEIADIAVASPPEKNVRLRGRYVVDVELVGDEA